MVSSGSSDSSRRLGFNCGRNSACHCPANWLEFALGVARQCTAATFIRSYDDGGIGAQGAAGLFGLHCRSRSISALRSSAESGERKMTMRRSSNIAKDGIQEPGSSSFEKTFIAERLAKHELPEFPANVFK